MMTMMTIEQIVEYVAERGINIGAFWDHAMGGDVSPLPRADVVRCCDEIEGGAR